MRIRIEAIAWIASAFGHHGSGPLTLERTLPPGAHLADLLAGLAQEHPQFADYALACDGSLACPHLCITLNGQMVALPLELGRELRDGDVVVILPAFAGGCETV